MTERTTPATVGTLCLQNDPLSKYPLTPVELLIACVSVSFEGG